MLSRRNFVASLAVAPLAAATVDTAAAADWPQRPVRIVYPYAAGSSGDAAARLLAGRLSEAFAQPFIVENRTGANGTIATEAVARASADGYTLLWAITPQIVISPAMTKVRYDPIRDLAPISAVSANKFALVVNAGVPVRTVAEFIDYVRRQGEGFAYAEGGAGSISHLAMALLLDRAGLSGRNVSYRGSSLALTDVIAGHLPAMFALYGDAQAQAHGGAIRMLAVTSERRAPDAPDIPTIAESGFPGFRAISWWGLMAPAGTPPQIIARIALQVRGATKDARIAAHLASLGVDVLGSDPAEFAAMISADIAQWARAVKIAGLDVH